jgi:2-polyprenyl-3-methyl-5-hydroxy-6-metoxy-1,4-benzoquinol methylase
MRALDSILRNWRAAKAIPYIRDGDRLLDVGCFDGSFISRVKHRLSHAVGIDPLAQPRRDDKVEIIRGAFPEGMAFKPAQFDCITLLAVLEHIEDREFLSRECFRLPGSGGRVIITVPRPTVDRILKMLLLFRAIDGMSCEQHQMFNTDQTVGVFEQAGFRLVEQRRFQLGLNCLFVFAKP